MVLFSFIVMFITGAAAASTVSYPIYEKRMMAPSATLIMKLPSMSVVTPLVAPFSDTDTPMRGSPAESVTVPRAVMAAQAPAVPMSSMASKTAKDFTLDLRFSIWVILDR